MNIGHHFIVVESHFLDKNDVDTVLFSQLESVLLSLSDVVLGIVFF
jgi:hypothetical protein